MGSGGEKRAWGGLLLALVLVTGLVAGAVRRPLANGEAELLLTPAGDVTVTAKKVQDVWASVAGNMERPARGLAVLAALFGVACLVGAARRAERGLDGACVLAVMALPPFWDAATGIGGGMPPFALTALAMLLVPGAVAPRVAAGAVVALGVFAVVFAFDGSSEALRWVAPAGLAPLALGAAALLTRRGRGGLALLAILAAAGLGIHAWRTVLAESAPADRRPALGWVSANIDRRAWLLHAGDERSITRYYELAGHRTGHHSFLVPEELSEERAVRQIAFFKVPMVVIVGPAPALIEQLAKRYRVADLDAPDGVTVLTL